MNDFDSLKKEMEAQKVLYARLLELAETLNAEIGSNTGPERLILLMDERESVIKKVGARDAAIVRLLASPDNETWLRAGGGAALKGEIVRLVQRVIDADAKSREKMETAQDELLGELSALGKGRKIVQKYGQIIEPVYARFIDFKQ